MAGVEKKFYGLKQSRLHEIVTLKNIFIEYFDIQVSQYFFAALSESDEKFVKI